MLYLNLFYFSKLSILQIESMKFSTLSRANKLHSKATDASELTSIENRPFLLHLCDNRFENIFLNPKEDDAMKNLKKAIAALFQVSIIDEVCANRTKKVVLEISFNPRVRLQVL